MRKIKLATAVIGTSFALAAGIAVAAVTQNFTANIKFVSPLTLTKVADPDFGTVKASTAGTYVLSTAGTVTASNGGVTVGGTPRAGELTIAGSSTQAISITATTYLTNNGVVPASATCSYNGGTEAACNSLTNQVAPSTGKTLLVGLTLNVTGAQADGATASPTFNVNVLYN